jgi:hypothetical protein
MLPSSILKSTCTPPKKSMTMKKQANELNRALAKEEVPMSKKTHEEMLNIPGYKGSTN